MGGNHNVDPLKLPKQPDVKVLAKEYDALVARLEKGEKIDVELEIENVFGASNVPCHNVVADLVGAQFPDEFVIVQGHLDAWDGAEGAQDNGTGSGTTIEAARLIAAAGLKPRRTIRFILFGGEEQGLFGSEGYVERPRGRARQDEHRADPRRRRDVPRRARRHLRDARRHAGRLRAARRARRALPVRGPRGRRPRELGRLRPRALHRGRSCRRSSGTRARRATTDVHHTQYDVFEKIDPAQLEHSARRRRGRGDRLREPRPPARPHGHEADPAPAPGRAHGPGRDRAAGDRRRQGATRPAGSRATRSCPSTASASRPRPRSHAKLQLGASKKKIKVERGKQAIESVVDWTGEAGEKERAARAERRAAFLKAKSRK